MNASYVTDPAGRCRAPRACVASWPGAASTPLVQELFRSRSRSRSCSGAVRQVVKDPERAARRLVHVALGRFAGQEEIAEVVAFPASDGSSFIIPPTFLADGGISTACATPPR